MKDNNDDETSDPALEATVTTSQLSGQPGKVGKFRILAERTRDYRAWVEAYAPNRNIPNPQSVQWCPTAALMENPWVD